MLGTIFLLAAVLSYDAPRAAQPVTVDGRMDEAAWQAAPWTPLFVDIEGDAKPKPRLATRAKICWDERYLYVAAEMEHYFEFEINARNTGWDLHLDKPYKDKGKADNGWEIPGLRTAVALRGTLNDPRDRDGGWTVEMAFPWSAFNRGPRPAVAPRPGESWRMNFSRVEWQLRVRDGRYEKVPDTKEDNWVWSPQGVINMHIPEKWGTVRFR